MAAQRRCLTSTTDLCLCLTERNAAYHRSRDKKSKGDNELVGVGPFLGNDEVVYMVSLEITGRAINVREFQQ